MYERFFDFRERPFALTPDPNYFYRSSTHAEALDHLRCGIESGAGFIVLTGESGSGKTTLLQTALRSVSHHIVVARLVNTLLDGRDLVESIALNFGLEPAAGGSTPQLVQDLAAFLSEQRRLGRIALLVIDEAQNLGVPALEEVRMLVNLETQQSQLMQVALVGQPSLRHTLQRPELEQLKQRIGVICDVRGLDAAETGAYINHRLHRAAGAAATAFSSAICDLIHRQSLGLPRKINIIADAILLFAYGAGRRVVDLETAQDAIAGLQSSGVLETVDLVTSPDPIPDHARHEPGVPRFLRAGPPPRIDAAEIPKPPPRHANAAVKPRPGMWTKTRHLLGPPPAFED